MESIVLQRVKMLLANKGTPMSTIASATGVKQNTFSRQIGGENALSESVLSAIFEYFPDASADWVITGNGSMLKSDQPASIDPTLIAELKEEINDLKSENNQLKGENKILRELAGLAERKESKSKSA